MLIAVGAPLLTWIVLYIIVLIFYLKERLLGIVPKSYIPNYSEFYEKRWFTEGVNIIMKKLIYLFKKIYLLVQI